jgi:hypothetical protein
MGKLSEQLSVRNGACRNNSLTVASILMHRHPNYSDQEIPWETQYYCKQGSERFQRRRVD